MTGGSSLASSYNPRLLINGGIQQASNSPFSRSQTLARPDLSIRDRIGFCNTTSGAALTSLRSPAWEVEKRKDRESDGPLDLDLSLGMKAKTVQMNRGEEGDDGVTESNLHLSLDISSGNTWLDKITRLKEADEPDSGKKKKEEQEQEIRETIRTKKASTLDLTL